METTAPSLSSWNRAARVARYGTVALLMMAFTATHIPLEVPIPDTLEIIPLDKAFHLLAYMTLAFCALVSWELSCGLLQPKHYFTVWLVGTLYGAFDEITQIPVGRSCDAADWIFDNVGIVLGLLLFRLARPLIYRFLEKPRNV